MATLTAGTLATSTLNAIGWYPGVSAADAASISLGVTRDPGPPKGAVGGNASGPVDAAGNKVPTPQPDALDASGWITLPGGRGRVKLLPGDVVANDGFGNVFLIPNRALPKTLTGSVTVASGSATVTSATDIRTYGWQAGTHLTSSHIPAGTVIGTIAPDGLSFTLVAFATGAAATATGSATETATAGTFTHS